MVQGAVQHPPPTASCSCCWKPGCSCSAPLAVERSSCSCRSWDTDARCFCCPSLDAQDSTSSAVHGTKYASGLWLHLAGYSTLMPIDPSLFHSYPAQ